MDEKAAKQRREQRDDTDIQPKWPQRPARPQPPALRPHLDPPKAGTRLTSPQSGAEVSRSDHPTSANLKPQKPEHRDDPKETRALPVVEPSRFERTGKHPPAPSQPESYTASHVPRVRPQPGLTSHQQPAPQQSQYRPVPMAQPQVRKPGGWQYERDEVDYDDNGNYEPHNPGGAYQRDQSGAPAQPGSRRSIGRSRLAADPSRSYLSVNIEDSRKRGFGWLLWSVVGVLAIALIGTVAFALAWQGQYAGKVYAGVSALDTDLSGKTPDTAKKLLREKVQAFEAQPVTFSWHGKEWKPSAEQIGVTVDVDSTVDAAYQIGRASDPFASVSQQWDAAQLGYRVPLVVQMNEPALQTYLANLASSEIDQQLFEGDVRLNGTQVEALPGKEGRTLRVYETITKVRQLAAKLEQGKIELPVEVVQPSVTAGEVQTVQDELAIRISGPITATVPGKLLTLDRDALVHFTTIERNPDRTAAHHIELGWKDNELKILGDRWAQEAVRPAMNARFAWNNGAVSVLSESVEGFDIDASTVITSIKEHSATSDKREYALPGKVVTPTVSSKDIGILGIKELMGSGVSAFKGSSAERATNIRVAANLLNGAVVPPGGTFSFLQTMGGIDETHGFVEGYVIAAERTQRGVGGGVCQVSTTAFRAAFWSGVKITERNQHAYRVGWYESNGEPVGFDAAVFDPGVDLKFVNDSPGYILIQADAGPDTLTVNFYGTKSPGEVKLEGPVISNRISAPADVYQVDTRLATGTRKQVETAHGGLDTVITRRIIAPGQPDKVDQFRSSYKAWPNWFIVASPSQVPGYVAPPPEPTPNP